ncbi:hypothetical protein GCM10008927_09950 [Amylibacter ulvae]|uniref:DUF3576 domain-containing protein n=1 Tax=Paramylibacter ulvae TaxID=1651968 RepID=A0ABQ3CXI0_9RHOB|nr:DUF3576 domain-containing protein [Amylibacter ulvae]GHA47178.1 hypothetical protein GCM10008927_09950 [Amylibacter ulvae]
MRHIIKNLIASIAVLGVVAGCSQINTAPKEPVVEEERETIWDLFENKDKSTQVQVNKYIWAASLDVLSFLPIEAADPFTGVIVMGWGSAPGSSQRYRASVFIKDAALDARSLKVSVQTPSGAASAQTQRQIEDAILTRARQLRISGAKL